jgi:hypothetical protein
MTAGKAMAGSPILSPESVARASGNGGSGLPALGQSSDLSKLKRATAEEAGSRNELAWLLVLDNLVDAGTAETHWLDQVGTRLIRGGTRPPQARTRNTTRMHTERSTKGVTR